MYYVCPSTGAWYTMNINDKIKQILIDKNLTPSYFADEIGVQRSSISHILSGRNRPSFDIIQKIIRRFPELGYEWIMEEDAQSSGSRQFGQPNYGAPRNNVQPLPISQREQSVPYAPPAVTVRSQRNEIPPVVQPPFGMSTELLDASDSVPAAVTQKRIEKILIFYTDGSFREYSPAGWKCIIFAA